MNEQQLLQQIKTAYQSILANKLVGIYVHGSIAFGCFNWEKSDIDFLVIVKEPLTQSEKEQLIMELLNMDKYSPPKGFEMSVVLESVCNPFVYPTPYELHFSNSHKERSIKDLTGYCENMNGTDIDLAAHFTVTRQVGIVLCGDSIEKVFAKVPKACYIDSIKEDIRDAKDGIKENPSYFILNLCRVMAYLKEGKVLSKAQGGEWGIENLPSKYNGVIRNALNTYTKGAGFEKANPAEEFVNYMLEHILNYQE